MTYDARLDIDVKDKYFAPSWRIATRWDRGDDKDMLRIGEVAARSGVSPRSLRYYEERRLLRAERTDNGQRRYPEEVVDRVQLIQRLYAAGLNSQAVGELLPCVHTGIATPEMLHRLRAERDRISEQVRELGVTLDRLDGVISVAERHVVE